MSDRPPSVWPDFNHNGIPDLEEPAVLRAVWSVAVFLVRALSPNHTIIRKGVEQIEAARRPGP